MPTENSIAHAFWKGMVERGWHLYCKTIIFKDHCFQKILGILFLVPSMVKAMKCYYGTTSLQRFINELVCIEFFFFIMTTFVHDEANVATAQGQFGNDRIISWHLPIISLPKSVLLLAVVYLKNVLLSVAIVISTELKTRTCC